MYMIKNAFKLFCLFLLLSLLISCNKQAGYREVSTGMDTYEFLTLYPDAEILPGTVNEESLAV